MDSLSGDVPLKGIWIVYKEFRISVLGSYAKIMTRGIDLVNSLKIQTIRQSWDYFLSVLMFKAIRGLAPHYLCNDITMMLDVHGYNTRSSENMNLCVPKYTKEICKRSFAYKGSMLWNDLPDESFTIIEHRCRVSFFKRKKMFPTKMLPFNVCFVAVFA